MSDAILAIKERVVKGKKIDAVATTRAALADGGDPRAIMKDGLISAGEGAGYTAVDLGVDVISTYSAPAERRSCFGRRASPFSASLSASWNAVGLFASSPRRYFGGPSTWPCSHFAIVLGTAVAGAPCARP